MTCQPHSFDDQFVIPALQAQLDLFRPSDENNNVFYSAPVVDLDDYDNIIVCMSGGKDSIACLLQLLDLGADKSKIELWHHDVDGAEGSTLMDWSFMRDYNRHLARAFNIPVYFSWLEGGFEAEMLKQDSFSKPHKVETPAGLLTLSRNTKRAKPATRRRFPQVGADLKTRWCSSVLKIDVGRRALTNQQRFNDKKVLFITGERREESANRSKYNQFEPHTNSNNVRHVDAWRPVLHWTEEQIWDALQRHSVLAPVPYRLGWSRSSCMTCIFNGARIWATIKEHFPDRLEAIAAYEQMFGTTISRQGLNVLELASKARPIKIEDAEALKQALSERYELPVFAAEAEGQGWSLPAGAYGKEGCGAS
ncbi:phosphoadenosine phosphosulfate reductase family protein [Pseudovibrio brasiliensis]|uniref:Phosphoadenosine phosphosulfate reductase family protein n=1 Tax=Pseudovibrio brasiliensis TaxID=1898042 RepID=A0ABX8AVH2_9HYPH|nr:phosphoadenosine phosphosulfate reductase family protein [Pseudovibrio brasiliensis]QUS59054.1 phosphoadenosine phosphosulfate reductase family protein [Pseudovibrio brasiliensis]